MTRFSDSIQIDPMTMGGECRRVCRMHWTTEVFKVLTLSGTLEYWKALA